MFNKALSFLVYTMANYIITKNKSYFQKIGNYNYCELFQMRLPEIISIDSETTGLEARHSDIFCIQIKKLS